MSVPRNVSVRVPRSVSVRVRVRVSVRVRQAPYPLTDDINPNKPIEVRVRVSARVSVGYTCEAVGEGQYEVGVRVSACVRTEEGGGECKGGTETEIETRVWK